MLTKKELQVLHGALTEYQGSYEVIRKKNLTNGEIEYYKKQ